MQRSVRIVVLNLDEQFATDLRRELLQISGVKIVAELNEPGMLAHAVQQFNPDLVFANLDPHPEEVLSGVEVLLSSEDRRPVIALAETSEDGTLVLRAMRAGVREFLTRPVNPSELEEAIEKIGRSLGERARQGRLITVMGSAGGVGATTLATNLAVELGDLERGSERDRRVALVDLDFRFGQVALSLDLNPSFTIADLCATHQHLDPQMIQKAVQHHDCGIDVLARPNSFEQADVITAASAAAVLNALQENYSYVVVDGPGRFDPSARAVLDIADVNFLVIQLMVASIRNTGRILEAISMGGYNLSRVHLVCNRVNKEEGLMTVENVEATLNRRVFACVPQDWKAVSDSQNMGEPLMANNAKSRVRTAIRELAERIHDPESMERRAQEGKKGTSLLRKLVGASR